MALESHRETGLPNKVKGAPVPGGHRRRSIVSLPPPALAAARRIAAVPLWRARLCRRLARHRRRQRRAIGFWGFGHRLLGHQLVQCMTKLLQCTPPPLPTRRSLCRRAANVKATPRLAQHRMPTRFLACQTKTLVLASARRSDRIRRAAVCAAVITYKQPGWSPTK